jgi:hypothetical protein
VPWERIEGKMDVEYTRYKIQPEQHEQFVAIKHYTILHGEKDAANHG